VNVPDNQIISAIFIDRFAPVLLSRFRGEWLGAKELQIIFQEAQHYFQQLRETPSKESLTLYMKVEGRVPVNQLKQLSEILESLPIITQPEFFEFELGHMLQGKALQSALRDAIPLYQEEKYENIFDLFQKAKAAAITKEKAVGSFWDDWNQRDVSFRGAPSPTGFTTLDAIMGGGLYPGETMLTIGLKSTGKTFFAVWIARAALFFNKFNVVYTMEISRSDFLKRLDCSIVEMDFDVYMDHKDEIRDLIMAKREELEGNLIVVEYPSGYPTVSIIENQTLELEQKYGRKVNSVVIDYIDLLKGTVVGAESSARFGLISAAVELRGMCGTNDWSAVILTQSNALGKKKPFIESENAAEGYGKAWASDFVMSINEVVGRADLRRLYIADSRRTQKKVSILYEVDFSRSIWKEVHGF
jgi:hypothetical protein